MIHGHESPWEPVFNPFRLAQLQHAVTFISQGAKAAKSFITDKLSSPPKKSFASIGKGQAVIIKHKGKKIAVYRDIQSVLQQILPPIQVW